MKLEKGVGSSNEGYERSPSFLANNSRPLSRATSLTHLNHHHHHQAEPFTRTHSSETEDEPHFTQQKLQARGGGTGGVAGGGPTYCPRDCQHQGKELLNTVVALPIEAVFDFLFLHDNFMVDVYAIKKTYDVVPSPWAEQEDGSKMRVVTYTMGLPPSNLGPKVSYVSEKQTIQSETQPGDTYVVELEANNSGIPYADSFYVFSHYCITREEDARTRLCVWVQVKYKKTVWGFMKGVIEKGTYAGVEALLAEISVQLTAQEDRLANPKSAIRRRRRANADKTSRNSRNSPSPLHSQDSNQNTSGVSWLAVLMLTLLMVLGAANVVLYKRLSILEYNSAAASSLTQNTPPPTTRVNMAGSWETVARILQRQEDLHRYQLDQWKDQLERATQTLAQVEGWLQDILTSIPEQERTLRAALEQQSSHIQQQVWLKNSSPDWEPQNANPSYTNTITRNQQHTTSTTTGQENSDQQQDTPTKTDESTHAPTVS